MVSSLSFKGPLMHSNTIKEQMSVAHMLHVASCCGCSVELTTRTDIGSVDASIRHYEKFTPTDIFKSKSIDIQLKATSSFEWKDGKCAFDLPIKNYNDFREPRSSAGILLVYQMPENPEQWLEHSKDFSITRYAMYWHNLRGYPEVNNAKKCRIHLFEENLFSPATLLEMMRRTGRGEELGNVL